jgi:ankyrin repeat protein
MIKNYKERKQLVKIIKFLIEEGAGVNEANKEGTTPFMNCAKSGEKKLCKFLVDRGVDPNEKRNDRTTALHFASQNGKADLCQYLVEEFGLDVNAISIDQMREASPLCQAARMRISA